MGRHVLKLYGISIVGILVILIPAIILFFLVFLLGAAMFNPEELVKINSLDIETIGQHLGKYIIFRLVVDALTATIGAFFAGGIYGTTIQAIFEGNTTVGNFFRLGARTYGKMYAFSFIISLLWNLYSFMMADLYNVAVLTGMVDNGTSLIIDIFLFIVFVMLMMSNLCSPIYLIKEGTGVFRSFILPFKTFGKSLLSTILFLLVFLGISLVYFLPGIFIIGITDVSLEQAAINNLITNVLVGIISIIYLIFVFPFAYSLSILITVNRYKNKIRPVLYGDSPATQPLVPGGIPVDPYNPVQPITPNPIQPPIQPPEQPKFTFHLPGSNSNGQAKQDSDEDTGRFTF